MKLTTLEGLAWLHDAVLLNVIYDASSSDAGRLIKVAMRCHDDCGYEPWEGKNLVLTAIDVAVSKQIVFGVAGPETVDAVRPGVSAAVQGSTMEARRMGVRFPSLELTILLHSGSAIEIICQELQIDIGS